MQGPKLVKKTKLPFPARSSGIWSWVFILAFLALIYWAFTTPVSPPQTLPISQVITLVKDGDVKAIEVTGDTLTITLISGEKATAQKEPGSSFLTVLTQAGVDPAKVTEGIKVDEGFPWLDILLGILPIALLIFFFFFFFRRAQGGAQDILSFGRSRAQLFVRGRQTRVNFSDVAGVDEARDELKEVVDFLKNAGKYRALGARIPKGVLLVGPAGTGKTLLARAVAGEANAPFYSMSGSEFMEMLVGVGAARVRDLFETAKKNSPSIIFIDEIESIGRQRGGAMTGGHEEREQTLNQILTEMDGFTPTDNVIVLAATNRPELLDPALTRPGRFDRRVVLDFPDMEGREAILKIHSRGKPLAKNVNLGKVAKRTVGFSGADLENMLNESAITAARLGKKMIDMADIEDSATKVKLGPEKKRLQSPEEKKMTAYHEGGHAIVAALLPHMDPVHRVSIVSRGLALGYTETPPIADKYQHTQTDLVERLASTMGGRAAEELVFKEFTAGASSDLASATLLARKMVEELGMSTLGPVSFVAGEKAWFGVLGEPQVWSSEMSAQVDREVKRLLDEAYERAKSILQKNLKNLDRVAAALLEKETLDGEEFAKIIA